MALPGIALAVEPEDAHIAYSGYQEGGRDVWRGPDASVRVPDPITVDTLQAGFATGLTDRLRLDFEYLQDTWSGATPILTAPEAFLTVSGASAYPRTSSFADENLVPYGPDPGGTRVPQAQLIHMMSSASAETRRQANFTLAQEWEEVALGLDAGFSDEPDFSSRFASVNASRDLNQKLTTLTAGFSYTSSDVDATLGPVVDWTDYGYYRDATDGPRITVEEKNGQLIQVFSGERTDWSASVGWTQVLDRRSTLATGLTYARSSGFLENPYKLVMFAFADPAVSIGGLDLTRLFNVPENRPDDRGLWTWSLQFSRYFESPDAALHLDYRLSADDWGITSHSLEGSWSQALGDGWMMTPRVRYYSQSSADFYAPYFILGEAAPVVTPGGPLDFDDFPVEHYSSDHRLSAFGAASGGLALTKTFGNGVKLEAAGEYYVHDGDLKLGGGGEQAYADFHYYLFSLGLTLDLGARSDGAPSAGLADEEPDAHADHAAHPGHDLIPASVMFAHAADDPGGLMLGYRYARNQQSGAMLNGTRKVDDAEVIANGCGDVECVMAPEDMTMNMHMVDLMYGASDRITLMAMFQFMDMEMHTRLLEGAVVGGGGDHHHGSGHDHHSTAGIGDTIAGVFVSVVDGSVNDLQLGVALSMPTGEVDIPMSDGSLNHYGMQTGSGTWDWQPSLTYTATGDAWSLGAQVTGTIRTGGPNESGYTLGNVFQSSAWTGYRFGERLSAYVRAAYTHQGVIDGLLDPEPEVTGPMDLPGNYGGRYWDAGVGLSAAIPGLARGDRVTVEWLQPLGDDVDGYQLERDGSLTVSLSFAL